MAEQPQTEIAEPRASWATKINYGVGAMGKSLSNGLNGRQEMLFLNLLHIPSAWLMPMMFLAKLWDGVNDVLMGTLIDNTRSKFGKFRPWIAIGAVTNAIVMIALFGPPTGLLSHRVALFCYVTVTYLLMDATYTMVDVAYYAMIPALSASPKERDQFAMIPRLFSGVVSIATAFIMKIVEALGGGKSEDALLRGLFLYALFTSAIYIATSLYSAALVKEPRLAVQQSRQAEKFSFPQGVRTLLQNRQVMVIVVIMVLFNMGCNLTNGATGNYFYFVMKDTTQQGVFSILLGAAQGIGLFLFPVISGKWGRPKVYAGSFLLPCVSYIIMAAVSSAKPGAFFPLAGSAALAFIGYGSMSVMQSVMLADAVDDGEHRTGRRNEGLIFSMLTMLSKLAGAFSSLISLGTYSVVKFGGAHANIVTPQVRAGINLLMYVFPPLLILAAFLVYKAFYKLTPARMQQVREELKARQAAAAQDA